MCNKPIKIVLIITIFMSLLTTNVLATCTQNPALQQRRSRELQKLVTADQHDRKDKPSDLYNNNKKWLKISKRDLVRRKRVGEIFGEGCITSPKDYLAGALIYQHGDTADHFYQAYIWAKKAAELGDNNGKSRAAVALDRYLITIGKKQLFGSQVLINKSKQNKLCFCMEDIELSFPDSLRKSYAGLTLQERYSLYTKSFSGIERCSEGCSKILKPTPKGTFPGLW